MVRELVVLGTASSVPTRHRNHNGYLLHWDDEAVLFDPGEGTQRQLLRSHAHASHITRICLTHFHGDHVLGLPGVLQRLSIDSTSRAVDVYFPEEGTDRFHAALRMSVWDREDLEIRPHPSGPGVLLDTPRLRITARRLEHSTPTLGYRVDEPPVRHFLHDELEARGIRGEDVGRLEREGQLVAAGRRVTLDEVTTVQRGNAVAVVMDTRVCEAAADLADGVDLLVCESTFLESEAEHARAYGHMTAADAARLAARAGARKLLLTHFSQRHPDTEDFVREAAPIFPNVVAATDLMTVEVPHRRRPPA